MRVQGTVTVSAVLALLLLASLAMVVPGNGGIDPRVPDGTYPEEVERPFVMFINDTIEQGESSSLGIKVGYANMEHTGTVLVTLEIYRWGMFGQEKELDQLDGDIPKFQFFDQEKNDTVNRTRYQTSLDGIGQSAKPVANTIITFSNSIYGYYRVRVHLELINNVAISRGFFSAEGWKQSLDRVSEHGQLANGSHIISEAGFTVVPPGFNYVSQPNKVPDFGDFTTPVIRPGEKGTYNFTVTNRYNNTMEGVVVTLEFYMWATIEESKPIMDLDGKVPVIDGKGGTEIHKDTPDIPSGGSQAIRIVISTKDDTVKGTYFVRHSIRFTYENETFIMGSRGYFSREQWEGFDYTNLYYQLDEAAGIVPDSSFSVKDPVPLWPLATLISLCVILGVLAVVFYLAEEHGEQYPRLKKGLQYWTGRWEQRKRLMQQRLDDIRAKQEEEREGGPPPDDGDEG